MGAAMWFCNLYTCMMRFVECLCIHWSEHCSVIYLQVSSLVNAHWPCWCTVYPKKYAHGFVVLCFVVVMQSFIMNSHEVFIHIHQGCFAGTGAIIRLPQCQWSKPDGYGRISQCITTTKHSKAKTVCIFLGIYCIQPYTLCSYILASSCICGWQGCFIMETVVFWHRDNG